MCAINKDLKFGRLSFIFEQRLWVQLGNEPRKELSLIEAWLKTIIKLCGLANAGEVMPSLTTVPSQGVGEDTFRNVNPNSKCTSQTASPAINDGQMDRCPLKT